MKACLEELFWKNVVLTLILFDSLVKPKLLYGVNVLGCFKHAFNDDSPIEKLNLKLCKDILGVKRTTSNVASRCEPGRRQLHALGFRSLTTSLLHISVGKSNETMTHAYRSNIQLELTWSRCLKYICFSHGLGDIWENRIKTFRSIGATRVKPTGNRMFRSKYSLDVGRSTENENLLYL